MRPRRALARPCARWSRRRPRRAPRSARCPSRSRARASSSSASTPRSVCGTDVHIERWDTWAQENFGPPPMTFGHEMAGVVVAPRPGRRPHRSWASTVAAETHIVDWTCYQCRTGRAHVCQNMRILGVHVPGAFAQYVVAARDQCLGLRGLLRRRSPRSRSRSATPSMRPSSRRSPGQTVAVTRLRADRPDGHRRRQDGRRAARSLPPTSTRSGWRWRSLMGADLVLDARDDVVGRLRAETDGNGVDIVLEMSGAEPALHQGLAALTNGGRISLLGTHAMPATIDLSPGGHLQGHPRLRHHRPAAVGDVVPDDRAARGRPRRDADHHPPPAADATTRRPSTWSPSGHAGKIVLLPAGGVTHERSGRGRLRRTMPVRPRRTRSPTSADELDELRAKNLYRPLRVMTGPQAVHTVDRRQAGHQPLVEQLPRPDHPSAPRRSGADRPCASWASARARCARSPAPRSCIEELERRLADFKHVEAVLTLQSGLTANSGIIPADHRPRAT